LLKIYCKEKGESKMNKAHLSRNPAFLLLLCVAAFLFQGIYGCGCGDDDDDNANPSNDDDADDDADDDSDDDSDDDLFDPTDHITRAWELAEMELTGTPDLFTLFQIEGTAQNFDVELPDKIFSWEYLFYAEFDGGASRMIFKVILEPDESVEIECEGNEGCEVFGRLFLTPDEWGQTLTGLSAMIELATPELVGQEVWYVSVFEDLSPTYGFIGYYLQNEFGILLLINAETGQIVDEKG
jgi:hypothetical protein